MSPNQQHWSTEGWQCSWLGTAGCHDTSKTLPTKNQCATRAATYQLKTSKEVTADVIRLMFTDCSSKQHWRIKPTESIQRINQLSSIRMNIKHSPLFLQYITTRYHTHEHFNGHFLISLEPENPGDRQARLLQAGRPFSVQFSSVRVII